MAIALKVMTWNVQQLAIGAPDGSKKTRAGRVARAILDLPLREQPDVIAFNEVFDEDGRIRLLRMLKGDYPHFIKMLEHPGLDVEEDSGLMLFSKLPFLPLPTGGTWFFEPFKATAPVDVSSKNFDALAAKGVGVVRVAGPANPTTIAFTHTQASYDAANSEHADVRAKQLNFIREVLLKVADGDLLNYANSVIIGDLNVKGDPDDTTGEINSVFSGVNGTFGGDFDDGWRVAMHPPDDLTDYDPGYTQRDTASLQPNRYDYQCIRRDANKDIGIVPHHMKTPLRLPSEVTDHWALHAHLHRISPHCTPASAVDIFKLPPSNPGDPGSKVWLQQLNFRDEDMFHWVYVNSTATFSVWLPAMLEVAAFRRSDFTHELAPTDILSRTELPPPVQLQLGGLKQHSPFLKGTIFSCREPFFLRIRGIATSFSGAAGFALVEHRGESPATAFVLHPHLTLNPGLPFGQKLGLSDQCFFRADRPDRFSQKPYDDKFVLDNPAATNVTFEFSTPPAGSVSGTQSNLMLVRSEAKETLLLMLTRTNTNDVQFSVTWRSPLTFVALDESFRLHVDEETGVTSLGADEFDLVVDIDGVNVYNDSWDDADEDEDWPGLSDSIRSSVSAKMGAPTNWAAFTDAIYYDAIKTDGAFAHGSTGCSISPLSERDGGQELRTGAVTVIDPAGDGHLTAHTKLSKFPPF